MASPSSMNCCVWDQYKYALYTRFREPKLYRYASHGDWDMIPDRCKVSPKEAAFVHKYAPMDTALHRVLRTRNSFVAEDLRVRIFDMKRSAIEALVEANPAGTRWCDSVLRTPLHLACMDVAGNVLFDHQETTISSRSILDLLLDKAPETVSVRDIEQRTPLHYLIARNDFIPAKLVQRMVDMFPESIVLKDEVGESPFDILQSRRDEIINANELEEVMVKVRAAHAL